MPPKKMHALRLRRACERAALSKGVYGAGLSVFLFGRLGSTEQRACHPGTRENAGGAAKFTVANCPEGRNATLGLIASPGSGSWNRPAPDRRARVSCREC